MGKYEAEMDKILDDRGKVYGDWRCVSKIAQALKYQVRSGVAWADLSSSDKESIDLICTKMARWVCGGNDDGKQNDTLNDIAGYARLSLPPERK